MKDKNEYVNKAYEQAKELYAAYGVNTDAVLAEIAKVPVSLHCWQGDDVGGFEIKESGTDGGGIMATGNYPGKARNGEELRQDIDKALELIPGKHRINLHASYAETNGSRVERDQLDISHFSKWIAWAKDRGLAIDFNPTFFAHKMADSGYTLSSKDEETRSFWVRHAIKCREIAAQIGKELGAPCINNLWIPDGSKDLTVDRIGHRSLLKQSLDEIFQKEYDSSVLIDALESKLFGIGSESFVVGSHEFYMGYTAEKGKMLCLDAGHFHPTENIADKISSILTFSDGLLLHVSRGVRWDSDHVVILNDDLIGSMQEIRRCNAYDKVHIALDFFDASINRITAWVTGTRATQKAILISMLEPLHLLQEAEKVGNLGNRLALMEEFKALPFGAVWNKYCLDSGVPTGTDWIEQVKQYEENVLSMR